jgi:predicted secreted protein
VSTTEPFGAGDHLDLVLRPGEDHEVVLPSLGGAGYVWQHEVDGDDGVIEVVRRRGAPPAGRVAGRATPEVVHIAARNLGTVTVRLRQRRPWESGVEPRATLRVTVEVTDREPS